MPDAIFVPMTDELSYSRYFIKRWEEGLTFINVEHDVVPSFHYLTEMWNCSELWCGCGYKDGDCTPYLGCIKISDKFIQLHQDMWVERPWRNCDVYMANKAKVPYHFHGVATHLH